MSYIYINSLNASCESSELKNFLASKELKDLSALLDWGNAISYKELNRKHFDHMSGVLNGFPAQCGTIIISNFECSNTKPEFVKKFVDKVVTLVKGLEYSTLMATMPEEYMGSLPFAFEACGFAPVHNFYNRRSRRKNLIFVKDIPT